MEQKKAGKNKRKSMVYTGEFEGGEYDAVKEMKWMGYMQSLDTDGAYLDEQEDTGTDHGVLSADLKAQDLRTDENWRVHNGGSIFLEQTGYARVEQTAMTASYWLKDRGFNNGYATRIKAFFECNNWRFYCKIMHNGNLVHCEWLSGHEWGLELEELMELAESRTKAKLDELKNGEQAKEEY